MRKHKIGWNEYKILDREQHWKKRKIKESLYINALNPSPSIGKIMNLEKGFKIDPLWNALSDKIKSSMPEHGIPKEKRIAKR